MRALGYPRVVSMESFRTLNFELVADCLEFLVTRYDETAVVEGDISAEADRVLPKNANAGLAQKARARLNLKRLYSADGVAVKELLAIADVLRKAVLAADDDDDDDDDDDARKPKKRRRRKRAPPRRRTPLSTGRYGDAKRELASAITDVAPRRTTRCVSRRKSCGRRVCAPRGVPRMCARWRSRFGERIRWPVAESVDGLERGLSDLAKDEKTLRGVPREKKSRAGARREGPGSLVPRARRTRTSSTRSTRACRACTLSTWKSTAIPATWRRAAGRRADERRRRRSATTCLRAMRGRLREEEMRVLRGEEDVGDDFEDEFDESEAGETFGSRGDASAKKKTARRTTRSRGEPEPAREKAASRTLNQFPRRVGSASGAASSGNRADRARAGEARGRGLRDGGRHATATGGGRFTARPSI